MKINPHKLQCMTTAMRLLGFCSGMDNRQENEPIRVMMQAAARLLLVEWNEFAQANDYEMYGPDGKPLNGNAS